MQGPRMSYVHFRTHSGYELKAPLITFGKFSKGLPDVGLELGPQVPKLNEEGLPELHYFRLRQYVKAF